MAEFGGNQKRGAKLRGGTRTIFLIRIRRNAQMNDINVPNATLLRLNLLPGFTRLSQSFKKFGTNVKAPYPFSIISKLMLQADKIFFVIE